MTPDGGIVVSETTEGALHLTTTGGQSQSIKTSGALRLLAAAPDGQSVVAVEGAKADCLSLTNGQSKVLFTLPTDIKEPTAACFSADNRTLYIVASDGAIYRVSRNEPTQATLLGKADGRAKSIHVSIARDRLLVHLENGSVSLFGVDESSAKVLFESKETKFTCSSLAGTRFVLGDEAGVVHEIIENPPSVRELFKLGSNGLVRLASDSEGSRCVAESTDKRLYQINLVDGVWTATRIGGSPGESLGLGLQKNAIIRVDTNGNLQSMPLSICQSVLGPEANVRAMANTADGRWLLACDSRGKLARWAITSEGIGKPQRCSLNTTVDDIRAFPNEASLCVLSKGKGLVVYNVNQDRVAGNVAAKIDSSEISALGSDRTAVIRQGELYSVVDFRTGTLESMGSNSADVANLFQIRIKGKNHWLSAAKSGEFQSISSQSEIRGAEGFRVSNKVEGAAMRNGLIQVRASSSVSTARIDSSSLNPFASPGAVIVASALGTSAANNVACDSANRVWFFGDGAGTPRSVVVPGNGDIQDVIWNHSDSSVTVATEKALYVIDAVTSKFVSTLKTKLPVRKLVRSTQEGLWCVGQDQRLFKLQLADFRWQKKLVEQPKFVAWHGEGKEVVAGTRLGTLIALDSVAGNQVAKVEYGKGEIRSACPVRNSNSILVLAGVSNVVSFDANHRLTEIPVSSALQLSSLATDATGRWLYASNNIGEILAWDLTNVEAAPKTIPCELRSSQLRFVEGDKLASIASATPALAFTPSNASQNSVAKISGTIEDFAILPDDSYVAVADGTSIIQLAGLVAEAPRQLAGGTGGFRMLAVHPRGLRVVAAGAYLGKPGAKLALWDMTDQRLIGEVELPSNPTRLVYSPDGGLIAVSMEDGGCHVFDGLNGILLEALPTTTGLNSVEFTEDARKVILGKQDGTIVVQPLSSIGVVRASEVAVSKLCLHGAGRYVVVGDASGKLALRMLGDLAQAKMGLQGLTAPIVQMKLSNDGRNLLAAYDDAEHSVLIWKLDTASGLPFAVAPDTVVRSPESRCTCAAFTTDSQFVVIGGEDGLIRAWSLQENREVSRFRGHTSAVRDVAPSIEVGTFVSAGADNSVRSWRFPGNLPRSGDPVPEGALVEATEMHQVTVPTESATKEEDRMVAARDALISGKPDSERAGEIFSLLSTDNKLVAEAKSSNGRLNTLERDPQASLNDIYQERVRNSQIVRRLQSTDSFGPISKFENALMQAQTNFRFDSGENSRPVKLRFSDRFLYAARPSVPKRPADPDQPAPDLGDNGALLSWEYRVTQLPSREWTVDEVAVSELFSLPNFNGAIAVPSMTMYSQDDGKSTQLPFASSWDVSRPLLGGKQLFAVGSQGANRAESEILRVYDTGKLKGERLDTISRYTSYEGSITALAFSNTSTRIAFCVRERVVHRLYVADAERIDSTMTLVEEFAHKRPWFAEDGEQGAPGITSLAFTPNDRTLIAHGRYDDAQYRLVSWGIGTSVDGGVAISPGLSRENKDRPFVSDQSARPIRFVMWPGPDVMIAEDFDKFIVWNLTTGESKQIPFLPMQRGLPQRAISDDGKWLIMGDDRGNVFIYDVLQGDRFPVCYTKELEQPPSTLRDKNQKDRPRIAERPAHAGPVIGVALSPPGAKGDFPEFAATIGEENRVIVWDLIPILGNRPTAAAKSSKRVAKQ